MNKTVELIMIILSCGCAISAIVCLMLGAFGLGLLFSGIGAVASLLAFSMTSS